MYKNIYLKRGKEESLKRFHPWVFSGAIAKMDEGIVEGGIVRVITSTGDFIAVGHYQIGSIAVRVLSFHDVAIDDEFRALVWILPSRCVSLWALPTMLPTIPIDWCMVRVITCRDWLSTATEKLP